MNDFLVFGGGYKGEKHTAEIYSCMVRLPFKRDVTGGNPVYKDIQLEFRVMHFTSMLDGREYLLAVHGDNPPSNEVLRLLAIEKPAPFTQGIGF